MKRLIRWLFIVAYRREISTLLRAIIEETPKELTGVNAEYYECLKIGSKKTLEKLSIIEDNRGNNYEM